MSAMPDHREYLASRLSQYLSVLLSAVPSPAVLKELQAEFGFDSARLDVDRRLLRVAVELLAIGTTDGGTASNMLKSLRTDRPEWFYQGLTDPKLLKGYPVEQPELAVAPAAGQGGAPAATPGVAGAAS